MDLMSFGIPYYEEGKFLLEKAIVYWKNFSQKHAIAKYEKAISEVSNPHLLSYLRWKYPDENILERCGETYPVAVFCAPDTQIEFPESALISLDKTSQNDEDLRPRDARYRKLLEMAGNLIFERPTFTMKELRTSPNLGFECELGSYFRCIDTCDSLEFEILNNVGDLEDSTPKSLSNFDSKLHLRKELSSNVKDHLRNGIRRSAAISMSTLIAYKSNGHYNLWIRRRSKFGVAPFAGLIHVIPSFMFQPATAFLDKEFSVTHNIYREYLEEIFNRKEPEDHEGDWKYFYGDPRLKYLQHLIANNEAKIYFSGISVNLLSLRPEICTVLLIHSDEWYEHHAENNNENERFHFNMEWAQTLGSTKDLGKIIAKVPLLSTDEDIMQEAPLQARNMVPQGAACFWLGVDLLRKIMQ